MSDSYGLKATLTMVINDGNYNLGATYTDTEGNNLDKQLSGSLDNIESDITMALLEAYIDMNKRAKEQPKEVETQPDHEDTHPSLEHRFAELERENQKLNEKIDAMFKGRTSTPLQEEEKEKFVVDKAVFGPKTIKTIKTIKADKNLGQYNNELELFRRLANLKLL